MKPVYAALSGIELSQAIAKSVVRLATTIPGLSSRLTTFPKARVEIYIKLECYDQKPVEVFNIEEYVDELFKDSADLTLLSSDRYSITIDESKSSADAIRRATEQTVLRPVPLPDGRVIEAPEANPLPSKENLDNIVQFGMPGGIVPGTNTAGSGKGRVIDLENSGNINVDAAIIRPKLVAEDTPAHSHFRVRGGNQ